MSKLLSDININEYDLFHMRYGKGAIIVALKNNPDSYGKINSDKYVAQVYANGDKDIKTTSIPFDPIKSIHEKDGFITISIEVQRTHNMKPSYRPIKAVIERIIPITQVTIEIVKINQSE